MATANSSSQHGRSLMSTASEQQLQNLYDMTRDLGVLLPGGCFALPPGADDRCRSATWIISSPLRPMPSSTSLGVSRICPNRFAAAVRGWLALRAIRAVTARAGSRHRPHEFWGRTLASAHRRSAIVRWPLAGESVMSSEMRKRSEAPHLARLSTGGARLNYGIQCVWVCVQR
jgi:hypothetical protein